MNPGAVSNSKLEAIKEPDNLARLWVHECERIYGDRLVNAEHLKTYKEIGYLHMDIHKLMCVVSIASF